jgi:hypothetical protein
MKNSSWCFTSDSIYEYAEVTSRAITHGTKPLNVVAMVTSDPTAVYVNHKNVQAIGVVDGVMQVWPVLPIDVTILTLDEVRKQYPKSYERV